MPAPRPAVRQPALISVRDIAVMVLLALVAPVAWLLPPPLWRPLVAPTALIDGCLHPRPVSRRSRALQSLLRTHSGQSPWRLRLASFRSLVGLHEQLCHYLREYRPGGWRPRLRVVGREHIEQALADGRGGILWVAPFLYASLGLKKGLCESGFRLTHLSGSRHGFLSTTRFGRRHLNPIRVRVENRYLRERVVIPESGGLGYLRALERRLRANELLTIASSPSRGQFFLEQPLFNGSIGLATGAPGLALATGAALLPAFTVRRTARDFDIIIHPPLPLPDTGNRREAVTVLLQQYARLVEPHLARYPHQVDHAAVLRPAPPGASRVPERLRANEWTVQ